MTPSALQLEFFVLLGSLREARLIAKAEERGGAAKPKTMSSGAGAVIQPPETQNIFVVFSIIVGERRREGEKEQQQL